LRRRSWFGCGDRRRRALCPTLSGFCLMANYFEHFLSSLH
jgi:hypothetical protein